MIGLLASQLLYIISRFYSGSEDGLVSVTEIELSKCRSSQQQRTLDTERRKLWHKKGGIKTVLIALAFSCAYSFSYEGLILFPALLALQVIIFNPIIAVRYLNQKYFYLSPNGWDGIFARYPKIYYFSCLVLYLACVTALTIIKCININLEFVV